MRTSQRGSAAADIKPTAWAYVFASHLGYFVRAHATNERTGVLLPQLLTEDGQPSGIEASRRAEVVRPHIRVRTPFRSHPVGYSVANSCRAGRVW